MEVLILSVPPILRLWQELQEINPDLESLGSKKSIFPSSATSTFSGATAFMGWIGSLAAIALVDPNIIPKLNDSNDTFNESIIIIFSFRFKNSSNQCDVAIMFLNFSTRLPDTDTKIASGILSF
jgi:hypothetical protein